MPKECVIIVIIKMVELENLGNAFIRNFMQVDFAKIAILINIIEIKDKRIKIIKVIKVIIFKF
jgi:hypothetical protein